MADDGLRHATTLRDYLQVVRRRKWIVLQATVLVPVLAVAFSLHQRKLYEGSAEVLLTRQNLATNLTGGQDPTLNTQPDRIAQTQADVARVPAVVEDALRRAGRSSSELTSFLSRSSVDAKTNADLLVFKVTDPSPRLASLLANAYAHAYTTYRHQLDTAPIARALKSVKDRLAVLASSGDSKSALYASLVDRQEQLTQMEALLTSQAYVVQQSLGATQVQPKPVRNGILGLLLGIVLGLGLAFLREALDTRVRTSQEISERLGGLPLLGRLPEPSRRLRTTNRLAMLSEPSGVQAEAFRILRTNLEFMTLDRKVRTVIVTSALAEEGKSTTVANLAVALARTGLHVALVDLDLRRPYLHRFFMLDGPGVTQAALGRVPLDEAIVPFAITDGDLRQSALAASGHANGNGTGNGNGAGGNGQSGHDVRGLLEVLPTGPIPPDPGEFVGTQALAHVLEQLERRADIVLIDSPPILNVGDAMTLSARVDGIILVTRLNLLRRHSLNDLARHLSASPAAKLGFVVTASGEEAGYGGYGYGPYAYGYGARPDTEKERSGVEVEA